MSQNIKASVTWAHPQHSWGGAAPWKPDNSHLLTLSTSWRKEGGLFSFKCKWDYGLNPQRAGGWGTGQERLPGFDGSLFFKRGYERKAQSSTSCVHLCFDLKWRAERKSSASHRGLIHRVELCVSAWQMLTSHEAIKEVLMRLKGDLFWVLMSQTTELLELHYTFTLARIFSLFATCFRKKHHLSEEWNRWLLLKPARTPFGLSLNTFGCL